MPDRSIGAGVLCCLFFVVRLWRVVSLPNPCHANSLKVVLRLRVHFPPLPLSLLHSLSFHCNPVSSEHVTQGCLPFFDATSPVRRENSSVICDHDIRFESSSYAPSKLLYTSAKTRISPKAAITCWSYQVLNRPLILFAHTAV